MNNEASSQSFIPSDFKGQPTLAAIALTQVVNIEARMLSIEEYTLDLIQRDWQFMSEQCQHFNGRAIRATGDGLLVQFANALEAVKWAVEMQKTFSQFATDQAPENVLSHRIGIHWGRVFASKTNAAGIGVNVAKRLLATAEAGTICVSQPVYEAIKNVNKDRGDQSELQIETRNLGLRELGQNAAQSVYQIQAIVREEKTEIIAHTDIRQDLNTSEDSQIIYPDMSIQGVDRAILDLEKSEYLARIKKLIFYICLNTWENDRTKLDKLKLSGLVQELIEIAPTLAQLKALLGRVVKTLNKSVEYALVANIILDKIGKIYPDYDRFAIPETFDIHSQVVQDLEQSEEIIRIKKLISYVCTRNWQNDPEVLASLNLKNSIQELHSLNPTLENLRSSLREVIKTITKQAEYTIIANIVIDKLQRLYPAEQWPELPPAKVSNSQSIDLPAENPQEQMNSVTDLKVEAKSIAAQNQSIETLHLFDARLEMIKYVNPLKVKMLVFSALNNTAKFKDDDLVALKTYELDDLLRNLLYTYRDLSELGAHLNNASLNFDDDQVGQVADVVIKAMQPIYERLSKQSVVVK